MSHGQDDLSLGPLSLLSVSLNATPLMRIEHRRLMQSALSRILSATVNENPHPLSSRFAMYGMPPSANSETDFLNLYSPRRFIAYRH